MGMGWTIQAGDYGETDKIIREETGEERYNIQTTLEFAVDLVEPGVISQDGMTIWIRNILGVGVLEWCTQEQVKIFESLKDPVDAPSHPYKEDPGKPGKFLWITGAPGLGKSTVAQLLARKHGFVFYEGDCFTFSRNPFIPPDVAQPSLAQFLQKPLRGEGLQERQKIIAKLFRETDKFMRGEDYDEEVILAFIKNQVNYLKTQRARIGGDWAVASVVQTQRWRDLIRLVNLFHTSQYHYKPQIEIIACDVFFVLFVISYYGLTSPDLVDLNSAFQLIAVQGRIWS